MGWDPIAAWYDGWVGKGGSDYHRKLAIPVVLELLHVQPGEHILDIGAGQGVLAPHIARYKAHYAGVDISPRLLALARRRHGKEGRFLHGDARQLSKVHGLAAETFDAAVFLLSIQDMKPLADVLKSVAWALRRGGRVVILMTHPCFRIPRQSGWGYDPSRRLQFRRVDSYMTPLSVPMKPYSKRRKGVTISFHRPLCQHLNGLGTHGFLIDCLREIATHSLGCTRAERHANSEIPLFLGLRAWKLRVEG